MPPVRAGGEPPLPSSAPTASQLTSMRARIRASSRASSGPKAKPKRKLAIASVKSNGNAAIATARNAAGVWLAPIVHVYTFMTSFAPNAASAQAIASSTRPSRRPLSRPSAAPARPTMPQAAICQGV